MRENKQEIATVVFLIDNGGKSTSVSGPRNPCHAEAGYTMPLQTVQIQIRSGSALFAIKFVNL